MTKCILLNGAIRDTEEFQLILDYILFKIKKYQADVQVVVSTWHEDISANRPYFSWLMSRKVRVVGSGGISDGGPANVFRQWRTLDAGLSVLDADTIVLKGRTDKFLLRKDVIDAFLQIPEDDPQFMAFVQANRLAIEHVSLSLPFMAKDMVYLGSVSAIRRILHYSVRTKYVADHVFNGIGPECFLWLEFCKDSPLVMSQIQKLDLRQVSNQVMAGGTVDTFDWQQADPLVVELFRQWIQVVDQNLLFLTDVLPCEPVPSWPIDEGSWRYQIGDRREYEDLKARVAALPARPAGAVQAPFLNSTHEYRYEGETVTAPELKFGELLPAIRESTSRELSDIVLLRQSVIAKELGAPAPDLPKLKSALHWNIRQRDRNTLRQAYDWLMAGSPQCEYLSEADRGFVVERMVDLFTFAGDREGIARTIERLGPYFKSSALLRTRVAEHHFEKRRLYTALYWFILSYRLDPNGLGVNHGLGCTLLDLGRPRLALRFLRRAHAIMPSDQTATFTLVRGLRACRKVGEARVLVQALAGELRIHAERMLGV